MLCILRATVPKSDVAMLHDAISIKPYRIDEAVRGSPGAARLNYDVMDDDVSIAEGLERILSFLIENDVAVSLLSRCSEGELVIDIGIYVLEEDYSKNLFFKGDLLAALVRHNISLALSLYQTSQFNDEAEKG